MSARKKSNRGVAGALFAFVGIAAVAGVLATVAITPAIAVTGVAANDSIGMFENLPDTLSLDQLPEKTNIYAQQGGTNVQIASFYAENRESVAWDAVSQFAKDAAVAGEDRRFYDHGGIDPIGVVRAAVSGLLGSDVQGASTITQQYVKNVLVEKATSLAAPKDREAAYEEATKVSLDRKLKEMRLAIGLEKKYTKDQILLGYLNIALFGGTVYGIEAASEYYYSVAAKDLTLAQAASLVAIVNNPEKFRLDDPENLAANKVRRDHIIDAMLEEKMITQQEHDDAVASEIVPVIKEDPQGCMAAGNAGYFCDYVVNVIENDPVFGDTPESRYNAFASGGFDVYTTLNLDLQNEAQAAIDANVGHVTNNADLGAASVAVQAGTGQILVMAQNKNFNNTADAGLDPANSAINYNTDTDYGGSEGFQAASTYKVFTLIAWLRAGHSLNETVNVTPKTWDLASFKSCDGGAVGPWAPANDEGERGNYTVMKATAGSVNGGFVAMGNKLDQCDIRKAATDLGVHTAEGAAPADNPGAILGTNYVSGLTMAAAYAGIANNGVVCTPIAITSMVNPDGSQHAIPQSTCTQGIEKDIANAAAYALKGVITNGTATASNPNDGIDHMAKTGTSDYNYQTWTTGASTKVGLAVWVGQATGEVDLRKLTLGSGSAATARHRIWKPTMRALDNVLGGDSIGTPLPQYLNGVQVTVPDVSGQTIQQAQTILEAAGFAFKDGGAQSSALPAGTVIGSDPAGGSKAGKGAEVTVYTSDGTGGTTVPNVTGQKRAAAVALLTASGFDPNNIEYTWVQGTVQNGPTQVCTVTAQDPAPNSAASKSDSVSLTVAGMNSQNNGSFEPPAGLCP